MMRRPRPAEDELPLYTEVAAAEGEVAPQANTWEDAFFDGDDSVLAVFDFDYPNIIKFRTQLKAVEMLFPPNLIAASLCCYPCFLRQNVRWSAEAQHVALTHDGIRFVVDKHPTLCGLACSDKGRVSKTVPYDKLTDCDVEEPAGNACICCVKNILTTINVDTASSGGPATPDQPSGSHELSLVGLKRPLDFKKAVWAMKRGEPLEGIAVPETFHMAQRGVLRGTPGASAAQQETSDLARRARAYDAFVARAGNKDLLGPGISKVDILVADRDYGTVLNDASRLVEDGLLTHDDFRALVERVKQNLSGSPASATVLASPTVL